MSKKVIVRVSAGKRSRSCCPVHVELPWKLDEKYSIDVKDASSGRSVVSQMRSTQQGIEVHWFAKSLKASEIRRYEVSLSKAPTRRNNASGGVQLVHDVEGARVDVLVNRSLFTSYHYGDKWVRPFLYPVMAPGGVCVTRGWPVVKGLAGEKRDHSHHKSIWVAYGECGETDNWSEEPGHGAQKHIEFLALESGPIFGRLLVRIEWRTNEGKKQFEELREIRVYAGDASAYTMDHSSTFIMDRGRVIFSDTKEGGILSVRVATAMDGEHSGIIENAYGGRTEAETWGKRSPWCDYSGVTSGKHVGIAVFDHEDNPRYPTRWHVRDYGLMTANCLALSYYRPEAGKSGAMVFDKGSRTTWRYRVYIHKGNVRTGKVANRYLDYLYPPSLKCK